MKWGGNLKRKKEKRRGKQRCREEIVFLPGLETGRKGCGLYNHSRRIKGKLWKER